MASFSSACSATRRARLRAPVAPVPLAPVPLPVPLLLLALCLPGLACTAARAQPAGPGSASLPGVVVTATRFAENAADLPFGVSVVTAEQIEASGVATVNEAIMKLLGVPGRVDLYGGGDYALDLRGFGATADNNQVVIVDGIRINEADLGGTRLAGIPIDAVARIEVIRGSGTVLYGEGATAGVIVITTKAAQGAARQNRADLYAGAGSFGLREARGTATLATGGFSLDASANRRDADNDRDNFRSKTDGASATGQWSNDWLRAGVRYARDSLDTGLPGALSAAEYAANPHQSSHPNDSASIRNTRSGLFSQATLGNWQLGFDAGWRDKALRSSLPSISSDFTYAYDVAATNYSLRARNELKLGQASNSLVLGWDSGAWKRTGLGVSAAVSKQSSRALYLRDEYGFAAGTRVSAGWRSEHIEVDSGAAASLDRTPHAWELGIVQPLAAGVAAFGRIGKSFRLANVDELAPTVTLRPQTSRDTELGGRWSHASGRLELRFYRNALTDEIGFDPNAAGAYPGFFGANVNFDPTRRQGVELEVTQAVNASTDLRINAASRRARFEAGPYAGKEVPLTPKQTLSLRADWRPVAGQRIDGGVNFVASQSPDFENACKMPSYTTVDLRYAVQWKATEFALAVANLANRKYYTQAFACTNGATTAIYPDPGRALTASLRVHF